MENLGIQVVYEPDKDVLVAEYVCPEFDWLDKLNGDRSTFTDSMVIVTTYGGRASRTAK